MNGFVPAIVAVMLAEMGPRALLYADARRQEIILWFIAAVVFLAGAAGVFAGRTMNAWANALMIAITGSWRTNPVFCRTRRRHL